MEFKIESMNGHTDTKRVKVVPSHEDGGFVFDHPHYGRRIVGWLGVRAYIEDTQELLESGAVSTDQYFKPVEDSVDTHAVPGLDVVAILDIPGSRNSVTVEVELFREVAPVAS